MKKLTLILLAVLLFANISAQDNIVIAKTRSCSVGTETREYVNGEFKSKVLWGKEQDISMQIAIDTKNWIVKIDNNSQTVLKMTEKYDIVKDIDNDGDAYTIFPGSAIDQNGKVCYFSLKFYDNINIVGVYVFYDNFYIRYSAYNPTGEYGDRYEEDVTGKEI